MNIILHRLTFNDTSPTYGVLMMDTMPLCVTLELPWKDNAENISCIPPGAYPCTLLGATDDLPYPHFAVNNVPGRTGIRIHIGNSVADVEGCIAVGHQFGTNTILDSGDAMNFIRTKLPNAYTLTIINP